MGHQAYNTQDHHLFLSALLVAWQAWSHGQVDTSKASSASPDLHLSVRDSWRNVSAFAAEIATSVGNFDCTFPLRLPASLQSNGAASVTENSLEPMPSGEYFADTLKYVKDHYWKAKENCAHFVALNQPSGALKLDEPNNIGYRFDVEYPAETGLTQAPLGMSYQVFDNALDVIFMFDTAHYSKTQIHALQNLFAQALTLLIEVCLQKVQASKQREALSDVIADMSQLEDEGIEI